jgi:predicted kinase
LEAIIFCGIQGSGKSTYYKEHFFGSHVRISLDLLKTRNREKSFFELCLRTRQKLVVDNTNPTREDRATYLLPAKAAGFRVICLFFLTDVKLAVERNAQREGKAKVPPAGLFGTLKKFQAPTLDEGFDEVVVIRG